MHSIFVAALAFSGVGISQPAAATETITYTYDEQGRLTQVSHSGSVNNGQTATYGYDKADNRTSLSVSGASH